MASLASRSTTMHGVGSRNKLRVSHARFYPGDDLLQQLGRAVCAANCLPRKELHEAWELATRIAPAVRGRRVVDLCAGYGLLAQVVALLDASCTAVAVDVRLSQNHDKVHAALCAAFPTLAGRVRFVTSTLQAFPVGADDVVVSAHACGGLTDAVIDRAAAVGADVAVLPCCHQHRFRADLQGLADPSAAIDAARAAALSARGYRAWLEAIPVEVSPKNTLLRGERAGASP